MSERRHTPGPWFWDFNGVGGHWALLADRGPNESPEHVRIGGPPNANPNEGDKALIAAAPTMLEALMAVVYAIQASDPDDENPDLRDAHMKACNAIAKAREGERT